MLDAFIIEKIQSERESGRPADGRVPLHIEPPSHPDAEPGDRSGPKPPVRGGDDEQPRGSVIIDFQL